MIGLKEFILQHDGEDHAKCQLAAACNRRHPVALNFACCKSLCAHHA